MTTETAVPPLAGVCSYEHARRVGYSVDENVRRLLRYHWVERRLMQLSTARLIATPEWEVKGALALHQWLDAEHADALRRRASEMRHPAPRMDVPPHPGLERFVAAVERAPATPELLAGVYRVARAALADAYREHLRETNPLVDHPTRRILRFALLEEEEMLEWGDVALRALLATDPSAAERVAAWEKELRGLLEAAGGVAGTDEGARGRGGEGANESGTDAAPRPRLAPSPPRPLAPSGGTNEPADEWRHPQRDDRFRGRYNFHFPPQVVYNAPGVPADERNLALLCKRLLEMDVPEMMASFMVEKQGEPWEFYRDYARQLWDEARHSMMGEAALEARGLEWTEVPLNFGFSLRLNLHADPLERQVLLYAIEQSLMPAETGKRYEYETACEAGDALSAHFHDYDWADEVLHAQIGRRWLRHAGISRREAIARGEIIHQRTSAELERYRDREPQRAWWDDFVRAALGRPSAAPPELLRPDGGVLPAAPGLGGEG